MLHYLQRLWTGPLYPPEALVVAALGAVFFILLAALIIMLGLKAERKAQLQKTEKAGE